MVTFTREFNDDIKRRFWSLYSMVMKEGTSHATEYLDAIEKARAIEWEGTRDTISDLVYQSAKKEINGIYSTPDTAVHLTKLLLRELAKGTPIFGITEVHVTPSNPKYIRLLADARVIGRSYETTGIHYNPVYLRYKEEPLRQLLKTDYEAANVFIGKQQQRQQQKQGQRKQQQRQAMMITEQQQEKQLRKRQRIKNVQRVVEARFRVFTLQDWLHKLREQTKNPALLFREFGQTETLEKIYNNIPEKKTLFYLYKSDGVYHPRYYFKKDGITYSDTRQVPEISFPVYIPVLYSYSEGFSEKEQTYV